MGIVRVVGADGSRSKEQFREISHNRSLVELQGLKTGKKLSVHCTRIIREGAPVVATKKTTVSKKRPVGLPFDFKKFGGERWTKSIAFDCSGIKAESHIVVRRSVKTYQSFNTYNGSLGKKGLMSVKKFKFESYATLEAQLTAKGYRRVGGKPVAKKAKPAPRKPVTTAAAKQPAVNETPTPPAQPEPAPTVPVEAPAQE
jgi:hypothetical protein